MRAAILKENDIFYLQNWTEYDIITPNIIADKMPLARALVGIVRNFKKQQNSGQCRKQFMGAGRTETVSTVAGIGRNSAELLIGGFYA